MALSAVFRLVIKDTHEHVAAEEDRDAKQRHPAHEHERIAKGLATQIRAAAFLEGEDRARRQRIAECGQQRIGQGRDTCAGGVNAGLRHADEQRQQPVAGITLHRDRDLSGAQPFPETPALPGRLPHLVRSDHEI